MSQKYPNPSILEMWRGGLSREHIQRFFEITDAEMEKLVTEQRSTALGLPSPYQGGQDGIDDWFAVRASSAR